MEEGARQQLQTIAGARYIRGERHVWDAVGWPSYKSKRPVRDAHAAPLWGNERSCCC